MIEIEYLLLACTWLILYLVLQLSTWIILRPFVSSALALPGSFAASLLFSCLISWYLAWLGLPPTLALGVLLFFAGIVLGGVKRSRIGILSDLKEGYGYYALFFIVFSSMLIVRMFYPDINGAEKFMDHAFLASIMRAPIVPPLDPWFAGGTLEVYYYLGHWCFAILGMIASIPSWILFQLVLPTVASVSAVQLYGVGKLVLKKFSLFPVLCLFVVNPAFIYEYITGTASFSLLWNSSRVIEAAITEYPLFTFLFGDVHAHALGIFNQTFFILLIVYLFSRWQKISSVERTMCAILTGISLGTMPGINSWDALVYGPIFVLAAILIWYQACSKKRRELSCGVGAWISTWFADMYAHISGIWKEREKMSSSNAAMVYLWILVPVVVLLSYAPFFLMMQTESVGGIGFVYTKTTLQEFLLVFGWFLQFLVCTLYSDIKKRPYLLLLSIPFILTGYLVVGLIVTLLCYLIARHEGVSDFLVGCGLFVVLVCEIVYMVDGMGPDWYRMNTIFKLYLPSWLLIGVGSICSAGIHAEHCIDRVYSDERRSALEKITTGAVIVVTLACILGTPLIAYGTLGGLYDHRPTLDGYAWMERAHPDDYAAIIALRELSGDYVLVEAEGGDYLYYGRMSSATGIPAILGWPFHETMWRGDNPPGWYGERIRDLSTM
jgi:YYY domain-containing protein